MSKITKKGLEKTSIEQEQLTIQELDKEQDIYRQFFLDKMEEIGIEDIFYNIINLFNTFINAHEKKYVFFYTDRELYIRFSKFINVIRNGNDIFKHEMAYKTIQASNLEKFLLGEKAKISHKFKDKNRYKHFVSLIDGGAILSLTEFLTPTAHSYKSTIELLTDELKDKNSFKEALNDADGFRKIVLLSKIQLLVDIYNYFYVIDLLDSIQQTEVKQEENSSNENTNSTRGYKVASDESNISNTTLAQNNIYDGYSNPELALLFYFNHINIITNYTQAIKLFFRDKITLEEKKEDALRKAIERIYKKKKEQTLDDYLYVSLNELEKIFQNFEGKIENKKFKLEIERIKALKMNTL